MLQILKIIWLIKKNHKKKKQNFIVFLDARTPAFIGDKFYLKYKINYDKKKWYKDLNTFLSNIEKVFKSKVIIVPHPAVRDFKNIYYDKKFIVSKDPDASNKLFLSVDLYYQLVLQRQSVIASYITSQ